MLGPVKSSTTSSGLSLEYFQGERASRALEKHIFVLYSCLPTLHADFPPPELLKIFILGFSQVLALEIVSEKMPN